MVLSTVAKVLYIVFILSIDFKNIIKLLMTDSNGRNFLICEYASGLNCIIFVVAFRVL